MSEHDGPSIDGEIRTVEDLKWLDEQVGFAKDAFLRKRGWWHSSDNVGSLWLWSKTIESDVYERGKLVGTKSVAYHGVSRDVALHMEATLDCWNCKCDGEDEEAPPSPDCPVHGEEP